VDLKSGSAQVARADEVSEIRIALAGPAKAWPQLAVFSAMASAAQNLTLIEAVLPGKAAGDVVLVVHLEHDLGLTAAAGETPPAMQLDHVGAEGVPIRLCVPLHRR
jgi:hypothetical protein